MVSTVRFHDKYDIVVYNIFHTIACSSSHMKFKKNRLKNYTRIHNVKFVNKIKCAYCAKNREYANSRDNQNDCHTAPIMDFLDVAIGLLEIQIIIKF